MPPKETTLVRVGNTLALPLDAATLARLDVTADTPLRVTVADGSLVVTPLNAKGRVAMFTAALVPPCPAEAGTPVRPCTRFMRGRPIAFRATRSTTPPDASRHPRSRPSRTKATISLAVIGCRGVIKPTSNGDRGRARPS